MLQKKRFFTVPVLALIALSFLLGTNEFIVIGILPEIAEGFSVSLTRAGTLVSVFAFAYALGTPFLTAFAARFDRRRFLLGCYLLFLLATFLCAAAPVYAVFLLARIATAVLSGTIVSVSMTFAEDVAAPEHVSRVISWIFAGFSVASVFGVPLATTICHLLGWRAAFFAIAAASLLLLFLLARVLPQKEGTAAGSILGQFALFANPRILLGAAIVLCGAAASYTFYTYLSPILQTELSVPQGAVSAALLCYGAAALASNLLSGRLAAQNGMRKMCAVYPLQAAALALLPLAVRHPVTGAADLLLLGLLMYLQNSPSQMHFLQTAARENPACIALASGVSPVSFNFGIAVGSAFGGLLVDTVGLGYVGIGGAALAVLAWLLCLLLGKICPPQGA